MAPVVQHVRDAAAGLVDLALPLVCVGCRRRGAVLCAACSPALAGPATRAGPHPAPPGLPLVWAVAAYDGVVRAAVVAHKESGRLTLAGPLGAGLARAVAAATPSGGVDPLLLVPAPSRRSAVRRRGHDPVLRMARRAAAELRRSGRDARVLPVLRVRPGVADQAGLSAAQRAANLSGALGLPARLAALVAGRAVVVVDDVVTTGATLAEAARVLRLCGARVDAAAVVAATVRRAPPAARPGDGHAGGLSPGPTRV